MPFILHPSYFTHPPQPTVASNDEKRSSVWIGTAVSLACIALILWLVDPQEVWHALQIARYDYLALCALCMVLFLALRAVRWRLLLDDAVPWGTTFHIQNIGYMLSMLLPFRLGDVARAVLIGNVPPLSIGRGASTMVVERLLDLLFFVVLLPFTVAGLPAVPENIRTGAIISGGVALLGIGILVVAANQRPLVLRLSTALLNRTPLRQPQRLTHQIDELLKGLSSLTQWRRGALLLAWSILLWLPVLAAYYIVMRSVGLDVTPITAAFITCVAAFSVAAPSSPGQIGVFHLAVTAAFTGILGQPEAPAVSFAILYHTTQFLLFILLGLIALPSTGTTFQHTIQSARQWRRQNG